MTEKLLPCPFCGGLAVRWDGEPRIVCNSSGCGGEAESEAAWNCRTPAPKGAAVAWRYRYPNDQTWQLTQDRDQAFKNTGEVQPLYASPVVPVGVRERVLDELDKAWLHGQRRTSWRRDESADAILAALRPTDTGANHD